MPPHTMLPDSHVELPQRFELVVGSTVIHTTGHKRLQIGRLISIFPKRFPKDRHTRFVAIGPIPTSLLRSASPID